MLWSGDWADSIKKLVMQPKTSFLPLFAYFWYLS